MSEKVYIGMGKSIETQYGSMMKLSIPMGDIEKLVQEASGNNGWVNLTLKERREPSDKGWTHYMEVDRWKPEREEPVAVAEGEYDESQDLPF